MKSDVKLVSYTQPAQELQDVQIKELHELVAYCARVSNPTNQMNTLTSEKIVQYLIDHKHWSPLEMVNICLEINTTRDIAHQIIRHRSFAFQEFSQRYAAVNKLDQSFVTREARLQDKKNRQNSIPLEEDAHDGSLKQMWEEKQKEIITLASQTYAWALENGIAKEQARAVLPEGCTMTRLYMNGTLRSWIHYISLRDKENGAQKEHADIARQCAQVITESNLFRIEKL